MGPPEVERRGAPLSRPIPIARAPASRAEPRRYVERSIPRLLRWTLSLLAAVGVPTSGLLRRLRGARYSGHPPACEPEGPAIVMRGTVFPGDARTYLVLPFEVKEGTTRLEVEYEYEALRPALPANRLTQTIFDLGLWDEHGYRSAEGFRGWSGSRHDKVFLEACRATRCYRADPINAGVWHVELGIAAVDPTGAEWTVRVRARSVQTTRTRARYPVDPGHVANRSAGWYHGDFHMHSWHSNPRGPTRKRFIEYARQAQLDFLPVTEYVVDVHWDEYGRLQEQFPDLLIWPGREIVTYFGHMQCIGETRGFIEYRHGFEDVNVREIQRAVRKARALFQVNHPTTFGGPFFRNLCRGCAFELGDEIDWREVDTIEVLNGPALVQRKLLSRKVSVEVENPFMTSAIEFWDDLLNSGFRVTAVCGSDFKKGKGLGSCATAVWADELSRRALTDAIRDGRAYVRTRGVKGSPEIDMTATTTGGKTGTFGSRFVVTADDKVEVTVSVKGGAGQSLRIIRNGTETKVVRIPDDDSRHRFVATRAPDEGPSGTWYRVETFDDRSRTTIGNPIFLMDETPPSPAATPPSPRRQGRVRRNVSAARALRSLPQGMSS